MTLSSNTKQELTEERKSIQKQLEQMDFLRQRLNAIDTLLQTNSNGQAVIDFKKSSNLTLDGDDYDKLWVWKDKCLYLLGKMGKAYSSQIADEILKYEPELRDGKGKEIRARSKTNFIMSELFRNHKVRKIGSSGKKYLFAPLEKE